MQYIYLDWNVIQYMKNETKAKCIDGPEFSSLVHRLSRRYHFPFSEGHLDDLLVSFKPENQENIETDLMYLDLLSKGRAVVYSERDESFHITDTINLKKSFYDAAKGSPTSTRPEVNVRSGQFLVDTKSLPEKHIFKRHLSENNDVLDENVVRALLQEMWEQNDDPVFYKALRDNMSMVPKMLENPNTILDPSSKYRRQLSPFLEFLQANTPFDYQENFNSVIASFLSIDGRAIQDLNMGQKIEMAYMLLDLHTEFKEKMNNKNRPSNMGRDIKHLLYASGASHYVTEDKCSFKKATFVTKALALKVKVNSMSDFMSLFC